MVVVLLVEILWLWGHFWTPLCRHIHLTNPKHWFPYITHSLAHRHTHTHAAKLNDCKSLVDCGLTHSVK